jgi:protein-disulfide isomerase
MFRNQGSLDSASLKQYAGRLGLDRQKFDSELDSGKYFDLVNRDRQDGLWLAVNATPTLFVNGRRVPSISKAAVKTAIENALKSREESIRKTASGSSTEVTRIANPR